MRGIVGRGEWRPLLPCCCARGLEAGGRSLQDWLGGDRAGISCCSGYGLAVASLHASGGLLTVPAVTFSPC